MKHKTRDGVLTEGADSQDKMLTKLYGSRSGRMLLKVLTAPWISKTAGWFLSTGASRMFIKSFVRNHGIDLTQFEGAPYRSYNDFFSRRIRPELRPVDMDPTHFVSPADSKLTVLPITRDGCFTLKQTPYTVTSLLRDEALAAEYEGGWALIFRLCVDDYHRYCYPVDGQKGDNHFIPGVLHTVNPIANDFYPIYKENSREYTVIHNDRFGEVLMMEVGALLVGRIVNHHQAAAVCRGEEKGYFQFGGSTVVLLVKADTLQIDADILENSRDGIETLVKFGEKVGISTKQ
jgi:phosphatidylserine decarboxylase